MGTSRLKATLLRCSAALMVDTKLERFSGTVSVAAAITCWPGVRALRRGASAVRQHVTLQLFVLGLRLIRVIHHVDPGC